MKHVHSTTYYKRIALWGYTEEEAYHCPNRTPLWMYRIEQREGRPVRTMLAEGALTARDTGYTLADYAREWKIKRATLQHWSTKWGIVWPRGAGMVQRDAARRSVEALNERRRMG